MLTHLLDVPGQEVHELKQIVKGMLWPQVEAPDEAADAHEALLRPRMVERVLPPGIVSVPLTG